ncbi:MAG: site-2 protease family protein, partial [Patescibacteria group bacterium]
MIILIVVISLSILILVHELGHFLTAKFFGVRVDEFGIGFPPKLFGKKVGGTVYSVNLLPFGGFVKIFGEDGDSAK